MTVPVPEVLDLIPLAATLVQSEGELKAITLLRSQGYSPELVRSALEQVDLRAGLDSHWPADWLFTRDGAEQASHPLVARLHAQIVAELGVSSIVDLTAGIGSDCAAMAERGIAVIAIERDPRTLAALTHNLSKYSETKIIDGDSDVVAPTSDAYFVDPARRSGARSARGTRALPERDPERWSPPLSRILARSQASKIFMKAAPAFEPPAGWARYCISLDRNLVEMFTTNDHSGAYAVAIDSQANTTNVLAEQPDQGPRRYAEQIGAYLFELDPAVTRANLGTQLALNHNLEGLGTKRIWLTGDAALASPWWRCYQVHDVFPMKELAQHVSHLPGVAIKSRDSHLDFNALRKAAKKPDHNVWAVVVTSVHQVSSQNEREVGVLVSRVIRTTPDQ